MLREEFFPAFGVRELYRILERLIKAPWSTLILDGKIRRHPAWRVVYDEGWVRVLRSGGGAA